MTMFPKYKGWLNENLGAGKPSPIVNDDFEDIRYFRGSVAQLNDWLNKKLEDQNKTWNPYSEMHYKHPEERVEKDNSIGYQDYKHGKDTHPENALATRRRGSKVDPAKFPSSLDEARKSYNLDTLTDAEYNNIIGDAVRKLDGIDAYHKMASSYGKTAVSSISSQITIQQYGKTDNTDALKKILKKADSNLDVNSIKNNFDATSYERSKHEQDKDIWQYRVSKKIDYHEAEKLGILVFGDGNVTDMDHEVVMSLMDMMAAYTSKATPLADIQWRTLKDFMSAASDYIKGSAWKRFEKDVKKRYPMLESKVVNKINGKMNKSILNEADKKGSEEKENREKLKGYAEKISKAAESADKARDAAKKAEEKKDPEAEAVAKINLQKANAQAVIAKADTRLFKHKLSKEKEKKKNESYVHESFTDFLNEKLARGLKPLLQIGSTITKKMGEEALLKLSDDFENLDNEQADEIAGDLNMAIEMMQDGYPKDATGWMKKFNEECKKALKN